MDRITPGPTPQRDSSRVPEYPGSGLLIASTRIHSLRRSIPRQSARCRRAENSSRSTEPCATLHRVHSYERQDTTIRASLFSRDAVAPAFAGRFTPERASKKSANHCWLWRNVYSWQFLERSPFVREPAPGEFMQRYPMLALALSFRRTSATERICYTPLR